MNFRPKPVIVFFEFLSSVQEPFGLNMDTKIVFIIFSFYEEKNLVLEAYYSREVGRKFGI